MPTLKKHRLVFMGTPVFAVRALHALVAAGHEVVGVYSQPPRPKGRGQALQLSPVHEAAQALGIMVRTPARLREAADHQAFAALRCDAAVVAAYGLLLPPPILSAPGLGCLNIHASLLPRWRGAAPIQRAILAGDNQSGVTIMHMDKGLDTGGMWLQRAVAITPETTATQLHDQLADLGAALVVEALQGISNGTLHLTPQPETGVTYAAKLSREEGQLDWHGDAAQLQRKVRALTPWPGVFFVHKGERIKVLEAERVAGEPGATIPGTLQAADFTVACGTDALRLKKVQRAGRAAMDGATFLRGFALPIGTRL